ncbi:MAG: transglycosylase domain-containing protein [Hyphomonas sp.]
MRFFARILEATRDFGIGLARWTTRAPALLLQGGQRRTFGVVLLMGAIIYFILLLWFGWLNGLLLLDGKTRWQAFQFLDMRARAVALYDSEGRYFGIVHPETENDHLGEFGVSDLSPLGTSPDHKAVQVAVAPVFFWRCVVYTEDRHRGEWRNRFGVDALHLARLPISSRGGSTIEMQLARSMWKMHSRNSNPLVRKANELTEAPVLNRYLVKNGDTAGLARWFSQHIPLVQGGGDEQGSIYGVYAAGQFLFGKRAEELDPAEQLVLAAAVRRPIAWPASEEARAEILYDLIGVDEDKSRKRAMLCASENARLADGTRVIQSKALRFATRARLAELRKPANVGTTDPDLLSVLRTEGWTAEVPLVAPMRLGKELAPNVQREVVAELTDLFAPVAQATKAVALKPAKRQPTRLQGSHPWRGKVREVKVTLDVALNSEFRARAREAAMTLGEDLDKTGRYRVGALPQRVINERGSLSIKEGDTPLVIAAADETGRIVRYYNSSATTAYSGYGNTRLMVRGFGRGPYDKSLETRPIGSVAKLAAALLIAEGGARNPDKTVSNACMDGLQQRCAGSAVGATPARVSLKRAFGSSLNPAVVRVLGEGTTLQRTLELMDSLGFYLPERHRQTPVATNLALGRFAGRPRAVHWLAATALSAARGKTDAVVQPYFVDSYQLVETSDDGDVSFRQETAMRNALPAGPGAGEEQARFLRAVLSQPVCDTKNGTLRRLSSWCADAREDVALHIAKTGSVSAGPGGNYNESDLWIAGGVEFADGRAYSYVISLGAGSTRGAFASDLGGGVLSPLADVLLRDLLEDVP